MHKIIVFQDGQILDRVEVDRAIAWDDFQYYVEDYQRHVTDNALGEEVTIHLLDDLSALIAETTVFGG